jgi:glycosyltransferase involved in cell wall biosynthesis
MKSSAYVSFDDIRMDTGTKVFYHEIQALKQVTDLKLIISRGYPNNDIPFRKLEIEQWYPFNPFLADYFAAQIFSEYPKVDFLHLACSPGTAILNEVKPEKYVVHIIAHDLESSISEHERLFGPGSYGYIHNTDKHLHKMLLKHADNASAIVTASTPAERWIRTNTGAKKVVSIPHGCEIPDLMSSFPDVFRVGYLGVFGPDKGLPYLFLAWKHFHEANSEIVFAGNCCQVMEKEDFKTAFLRDVERITLLGRVASVADFYHYISVYVQPSVTEGFGIEIPEAMSYGRPVIVTSTTGSSDIVTDGEDGFIVPPRDPGAILDKINYFYTNPSELLRMGNNARVTAKNYSWDKIEQQYIKFYQEILG